MAIFPGFRQACWCFGNCWHAFIAAQDFIPCRGSKLTARHLGGLRACFRTAVRLGWGPEEGGSPWVRRNCLSQMVLWVINWLGLALATKLCRLSEIAVSWRILIGRTATDRKGETLTVFADFTKDAEAALIAQVKSNSRLFFRLAYGVVRDVQAAEDVCQQAFLRAWELRGRIRDMEAMRAWLAKVVVNESLVVVRRRKSEQRARNLYPVPDEDCRQPCERAEFRERLQDALDQLPEQTRMVVVLRLLDGMSGNEVKSLLGCSASEVSRRLHQGMERLRGLLAGQYAAD